MADPGVVVRSLLGDGSLGVIADEDAWSVVEPWVPLLPVSDVLAPGHAAIRVRARGAAIDPPSGAPAMVLRGVKGWVDREGVALYGPAGRVSGEVDLSARLARMRVAHTGSEPETAVEVMAAFTLASALLLGRLGRTLVHAAAVVAPDGQAWLLAGGTFSGKSTTCLTLIHGGWDYLADDHVVIGEDGGGGLVAEGWPRRFNLDLGYEDGVPRGIRQRRDPGGFGPGAWRRAAPLGGVLLPRVDAGSPTALLPVSAGTTLSRLLQMSPWLLADREAAPPLLDLLQRIARLPACELRLGADCYADSSRLSEVLQARP